MNILLRTHAHSIRDNLVTCMKTTSMMRHLSVIALLCGLTSSCVTYTRYQDEPRAKVGFSSTKAAQTFYDAYSSVGTPVGKGEVKASIPLYLPYWQTKQDTENKKFNAAFHTADTNHDKLLSEKEARAYDTTVTAGRKPKWESGDL